MTMTTKSLLWIFLLCILLAGQFLHSQKLIEQKEIKNNQNIASIDFPYRDINLIAKSALVMDVGYDYPLFTLHSTKILPLASITKLMTAEIIMSSIDPNEEIIINENSLSTYGEYGLKLGEKWNSEDLVKFMLIISSNDAAKALRDHFESKNTDISFIQAMNEYAKYLGLSSLTFDNESGLDNIKEGSDEKVISASGSCLDSSRLLYILYQNRRELIKTTQNPTISLESRDGTLHEIENTDILTQDPSLGIVASKTGMTELAGGNLVVLADLGFRNPTAFCVLGSTKEGRFDDVRELIYRTKSLVENIENLNLDNNIIFN